MLTSGLYKSNTEHDCRACRETFSKAISDLTFQNKVLRDQVEAYKNGSKIRQLREMYEQQIRKLELKNRKLQCDNEDKDDRWMEVNDDVCKERDAAVQKAQKQADAATERANQAEEKRQDLKNEYSSYRKEMEEKLKQEQKENDKLSNDLGALQVEKNRNFKGIPFGYHFIRFCQAILPTSIFDYIFGEVVGIFHAMDNFTGRQNKQQ